MNTSFLCMFFFVTSPLIDWITFLKLQVRTNEKNLESFESLSKFKLVHK